jgi:hypothetical protein
MYKSVYKIKGRRPTLPPLVPALLLLPPAGDGELDLAQNANANGNAESQREREREESSRKSDACDSG